MKKYLALVLALVMALSLVACGNKTAEEPSGDGDATEALKALAVAHPVLLTITVTLGAIAGAVKIVDALTTSMKEQREAFENAQQDYTDACTKLDELKTKLSETTSRIAELIEKSNNGTITLVEQSELDKLKLTNEELRLMIQNQEEVKKQKAKEASDEAYKTYTRENRMETDDTASKQEQYYQASSDADGFHVGSFLDRASELSDFDYAPSFPILPEPPAMRLMFTWI